MTDLSIKKRIEQIQKHLGVEADGLIGTTTLTALENALFDQHQRLAIAASYSLTVSKKGLGQLVEHEISSQVYYNKFLAGPVWPGGQSGITIGIGYDLGYNSSTQIRRDWVGEIGEMELEKLVVIAGLKGDSAKAAVGGVKHIKIGLPQAEAVFYRGTLPRYAASTLKAYPGADQLHADAQAGLLSLVFNRGTKMSGVARREMAAIRPLVKDQDYAGIAAQIRAMKRLWEDKGLDGLLKRRDDEADLISQAKRLYSEDELVNV
tara:strand:- start:10031 stop:10819 length:789 start_codon:yes stop_codon:yes gene_type:complete